GKPPKGDRTSRKTVLRRHVSPSPRRITSVALPRLAPSLRDRQPDNRYAHIASFNLQIVVSAVDGCDAKLAAVVSHSGESRASFAHQVKSQSRDRVKHQLTSTQDLPAQIRPRLIQRRDLQIDAVGLRFVHQLPVLDSDRARHRKPRPPKTVKHKRGDYAAHAARKSSRTGLRVEDSQRPFHGPGRRFDRVVARGHELDSAVPPHVLATLNATQCDVTLDGGGRRGRKPPVEVIN